MFFNFVFVANILIAMFIAASARDWFQLVVGIGWAVICIAAIYLAYWKRAKHEAGS